MFNSKFLSLRDWLRLTRARRWASLALLLPALALGASGPSGAAGPAERPPVVCAQGPAGGGAPAKPAPVSWQALPDGGLQGYVVAILPIGNDLYAGGQFTQTADGAVKNLGNIARLRCGAWQALPNNGLNGSVTALAAVGSDVYAGGYFSETADGGVQNLGNIARLSGGTWNALANGGLNWDVTGLAAHGSDLYVGGFFDQTADSAVKDLNSVAVYSSGAWSALPNKGLNNIFVLHCCFVASFAFNGAEAYVGGGFAGDTGDHSVTHLNGLAKLSGGTWSTLPHNGLANFLVGHLYSGHVRAMLFSGGDLYVAGGFTGTADSEVQNLNGIAKLSGGAWSPLPHNGLSVAGFAGADSLAVYGGDLYVGGAFFTHTADGQVPNLNHIAKLSGGAWAALPGQGLNGGVGALAVSGNNLYVGGIFTETADGGVTNLNSIALLGLPPVVSYGVYLPLVLR